MRLTYTTIIHTSKRKVVLHKLNTTIVYAYTSGRSLV